ncbi:MAG: hypothetical protein ACLGI8_05515 [Acidimicrobiia bacterium]
MQHILFVGHSHLLMLIDALSLRSGGSGDVAPSGREMWSDAGVRSFDFDLSGGGAARSHCLLLGAFAPPFLRWDAETTPRVRSRYLCALDDAERLLEGRVDHVVSCLYGNEHSVFSLTEHEVPFDLVVDRSSGPVVRGVPGERQILPVEVVRRELARLARPTAFTCEVLRQRFPEARVSHLAPPPPLASAELITAEPELFREVIDRFGLAPGPLRRAVHELYLDELAALLCSIGVALVAPPPSATDADGYLVEELRAGATHANAAYGSLVLDQVLAL